MKISEKLELMKEHYKIAIEARDKLNENFHKWMTYYYVANGAVLVAITAIYNCNPRDKGILFLAIIGLIISMLWNLSCKGYYYWSKSWINIIDRFEQNIIQGDSDLGVYCVFSKDIFEKEDSVLIPNKPANISTPKLTLFFSLCASICWLGFSIYKFFILFDWGVLPKIVISVLFIIIVIILYLDLLPRWTKSLPDNSKILVEVIKK